MLHRRSMTLFQIGERKIKNPQKPDKIKFMSSVYEQI